MNKKVLTLIALLLLAPAMAGAQPVKVAESVGDTEEGVVIAPGTSQGTGENVTTDNGVGDTTDQGTSASADSSAASQNQDESAPGGLITCEGAGCTFCDVVKTANKITSWLIGVMLVIFTLLTAYAGFKLVTSGGNPQARSDAKKYMTNGFIGIVIVLCAWLLVDTLLRALLVGGNAELAGRAWSDIECGGQTETYTNTRTPSSVSDPDGRFIYTYENPQGLQRLSFATMESCVENRSFFLDRYTQYVSTATPCTEISAE
tara:strand:+ start:336 stop:1115 length:780 start_codon:yes stop_codon:yes gene_type:complete